MAVAALTTLLPVRLAAAFALTTGSLAMTAPSAEAPPARILFIGNSYTYFNNLPGMVERIAATGAPKTAVTTRLIARGGATLKDHWDNPEVLAAIRLGTWDYVVLQEQSTLGATSIVDGQVQIGDPAFFHEHARKLVAEIRKTRARPVLLQTWPRRVAPARDAAALTHAYATIGKELGAIVVPAGLAWTEVRRADSTIALYIDDGSHPSAAGSYLTAATFVAMVLGENPVGAAAILRGHVIGIDEKVGADSLATMVSLEPSTAAVLQKAAWTAAGRARDAGGYLSTAAPGPLEATAAKLPAATALPMARIEGRWTGPIRLWPAPGPVRLILSLNRAAGGWVAALTTEFDGHPDQTRIGKIVEVVVTDTSVAFVDLDGPAGRVSYRGVFAEGGIIGTAEAAVPARRLSAKGSWRVVRDP